MKHLPSIGFRKNLHLFVALALSGSLYIASLYTRRIVPAYPAVPIHIDGTFPRDGQFPGEPFEEAQRVRTWGSWSGSDQNVGTLRFGPFPAPRTLRFFVGGYPDKPGNEVYVELASTKVRLPVPTNAVGERWVAIEFRMPADWIGKAMTLAAVDAAMESGGWLAVAEPVAGGRGIGSSVLIERLTAWAINGLLLALLWFAALRRILPALQVPAYWAPLLAAGVVAVGGYGAFWIYIAHPAAGKSFSCALVATAVAGTWRRTRDDPRPNREAIAVARLLLSIGLLYLALLHVFPSSLNFYDLAGNRFLEGLPGDNTLPHNSATRLYDGEPLREPGADWLSSDRPPLQAGWQLLTWPFTRGLGLESSNASGTAAMWFQLLWIPASYGLLRTLRLSSRRASAWIVVMALSGFIVLNSVYTWPKLAAAALLCGAFGLWVLPIDGVRRRTDFLLGAALAGLAWVSHGGVAFSLLALAPWIAWRILRGEARGWALAAGVFLLFAGPWAGYQKIYDPPGNRLLKWHLGGQIDKDSRGTLETIRDGYRSLGWEQALVIKGQNLRQQVAGDWRMLFDFTRTKAPARRSDEFFYAGRALTWWLLGLLLLPVGIGLKPHARRYFAATFRPHLALVAWTALTIVIWCLSMFIPNSAVIHQGSYATMLSLFVLLSAWIESAGKWCIVAIALLQIFTLTATWTVSNRVLQPPLDPVALILVLATAAGLTAIVIYGFRSNFDGESDPAGDSERTTPQVPPSFLR